MDPNYYHYNVYFQDYSNKYTRISHNYEQFQALGNHHAESSDPYTRRNIPCERQVAEQQLLEGYFGNENNPPKYPERNLRRRYCMSTKLFKEIVNDITNYNVEPLPEYLKKIIRCYWSF